MMQLSSKPWRPSRSFVVMVAVLLGAAIARKPTLRFFKAQYDSYKGRTTTLTATDAEHQQLLRQIQAQQPKQTLDLQRGNQFPLSEKVFQAALSPELLGRSSRYEPYTHNGKLACAWMVNMVLQEAMGDRIGQNPLFVPSMVASLDAGMGQKLAQAETKRGDLAIANGTDYEEGQWHVGICANDGCDLVLSNSPFSSRFSWLTNANFDGAFEQYPGETTFYRIHSKGS